MIYIYFFSTYDFPAQLFHFSKGQRCPHEMASFRYNKAFKYDPLEGRYHYGLKLIKNKNDKS